MARFDGPPGAGTVGERLEEVRRRLFVGRASELALFDRALRGQQGAGSVVYIYGPGGVGKSALLRQFSGLAAEAGRATLWLDGRSTGATPQDFLAALEEARRAPPASGDLRSAVLLIDTYEMLTPLDDWLRETFLPQLPEGTLVVLAGRSPPSPGWRTDLAWRDLLEVVALRNLRPEEGRRLLHALGVARAHHDAALALTYGHPLALVLLADWLAAAARTGRDAQVSLDQAPDAVGLLVERILRDVSDPLQRQALEICSHARATTETLLNDIFGLERGPALFAWLRDLSFIEQARDGLYPHDLVRDAVEADLRWRNPEAFREQHARVSAFMLRRLQGDGPYNRQRAAFDLLYMHRHQPLVRPYFEWKAMGSTYLEPASPGDHDAILALVRRHEGEGSARAAGHWLRRAPDAFLVVRGSGTTPEGFIANLVLSQVVEEDLAADPGLEAIWSYVQRAGPLRRGEKILVHRFWMGRDTYQDPGMMNHVSSVAIFHYAAVTGLAWAFPVTADPDHWAPMFNYFDFARVPEADFELDGRRYGVFAHDLRVLPLVPWFQMLGERELASDLPAGRPGAAAPPLLVLSEPQFAEAVRQALRDYTDTGALARNPLLRSRLVFDATAGAAQAEGVEILRALLRQAVDAVAHTRRGDRLARALDRAFLNPAPSQEAAAELLDLPISTYRYHLRKGIRFVTAWLWQREVDLPQS